jgi:hypothetical protein
LSRLSESAAERIEKDYPRPVSHESWQTEKIVTALLAAQRVEKSILRLPDLCFSGSVLQISDSPTPSLYLSGSC